MIFKDKTVILTGGSEGVGAAAARKFADAGANLMLVARTRKKLDAIAEELREKTRVAIFAMDVADPDACVDLVKKTDFEFGGINILVNNAGYHARGPLESIDASELARMIDVNLRAPIVLTRLVLPYLREADEGAIINVGSLAGRASLPNIAGYGASKAGLRSFTYTLAEELRGTRIKVAIVAPGMIDTNFSKGEFDRVADINFSQRMLTADEVAQAVLDLCGNRQTEVAMPRLAGLMTTITYLAPWAGRLLRPALERKGARMKQQFIARQRAKEKAARQGE